MDLERVKKFVLVGSELNEEGPNGSVSEVRRRRALAAASFEALKRPLWKRSEVSVKTKMRGVQCLCDESVVVWCGDLDHVCKRFGVTRGISEQLPA